MPDLRWNPDAPASPGWYWFKEAYDDPLPRILRVFQRPGHKYLCVWADRMHLYPDGDYLSVQKMGKAVWAGPISEPS